MNVSRALLLAAIGIVVSYGSPASATALQVAADVIDINRTSIQNSGVCVTFEGVLKDDVSVTVRVPGVVGDREFRSILVIVRGNKGATTAIESAPTDLSGFRQIQISATRFAGELDGVEVQVVYIASELRPLVQIIDLKSLYSSESTSGQVEGDVRRLNCL